MYGNYKTIQSVIELCQQEQNYITEYNNHNILGYIKLNSITNNDIKNITKEKDIDKYIEQAISYITVQTALDCLNDINKNYTNLLKIKLISDKMKTDILYNIKSHINNDKSNIDYKDDIVDYTVFAIYDKGVDDNEKFINNINLSTNDKYYHKYNKLFVIKIHYKNCNNINKLQIKIGLYEINYDMLINIIK